MSKTKTVENGSALAQASSGHVTKLAAAYDLGLSAAMVRYNVLYYFRFPINGQSLGGRNFHDCLKWVGDDLLLLQPEINARERARDIGETIQKLQICLTERRLSKQTKRSTLHETEAFRRLRTLWNQLQRHCNAAMRERPRLGRCYQLGRAMASCYLDRHREAPKISHDPREKVFAVFEKFQAI